MRVLEIFEEICRIPHGSGNCENIALWCVDFAKRCGLRYVKDEHCNVIIYKDGTEGYEGSPAVIMQGHLDMVCQKADGLCFDFKKDAIKLLKDGDYIKAEGTTLGADDGVAVAIILAILESNNIPHPPIEAVFTSDEEVGMLGALALDMSLLSGKYMLNIDSEELDVVTVSCAGGKDVRIDIPISRQEVFGACVEIDLFGLKGGHSGVEINKNRINATSLMGRVLSDIKNESDFELISITGGDKTNAITRQCTAQILAKNLDEFVCVITKKLDDIKKEIFSREENFEYRINVIGEGTWEIISGDLCERLVNFFAIIPSGVYEMSAEIPGLVESSQNLGVLKTTPSQINLGISLRSSRASVIAWLEERLSIFAKFLPSTVSSGGAYPPWEFCTNSRLQSLYREAYFNVLGSYPKIEAVHAGLECGVFSSALSGLDCISVGPNLTGVHTTEETLQISSVETVYKIILETIKSLK